MQVKSNQNIAFVFCTADPATGTGTEVTSATGALWVNGVVNAASVSVVDDAGAVVGVRKVSYTVPSGLTEGDTVQCVITATVGGITASSVLRDDQVVAVLPGELPTTATIATAVWATRKPGDYPTGITYNAHGDINTVFWHSGKTWTYAYNGSFQLTGITEA
jgi:YD repeat-containing protein